MRALSRVHPVALETAEGDASDGAAVAAQVRAASHTAQARLRRVPGRRENGATVKLGQGGTGTTKSINHFATRITTDGRNKWFLKKIVKPCGHL